VTWEEGRREDEGRREERLQEGVYEAIYVDQN
jgi:hypothetical protein